MTADVDLDTLTRLAQAATPGPWQHQIGGNNSCSAPRVRGLSEAVQAGLNPVALIGPAGDQCSQGDAAYIAAVSPGVVLALVERVRAAESAIELLTADPMYGHGLSAFTASMDALDNPGAPATTEVDPESTDDPNGPQNAANEGGADLCQDGHPWTYLRMTNTGLTCANCGANEGDA